NVGTGGALAKVGNASITDFEYAQALRRAQERMREMAQNADPELWNSPQFRESVLNEMVDRQVMLNRARDAGLAVSAPELQRVISQFQAFHDESGRFSVEKYRMLLRNQGVSEVMFEQDVRNGILLGQLDRKRG